MVAVGDGAGDKSFTYDYVFPSKISQHGAQDTVAAHFANSSVSAAPADPLSFPAPRQNLISTPRLLLGLFVSGACPSRPRAVSQPTAFHIWNPRPVSISAPPFRRAAELFNLTAAPMIQSFLDGYNVTVSSRQQQPTRCFTGV
ncbi:MAG: hypothetical protein AAFU61_18300, partial [Pseudomonadota bacterium]